MPEHLARERRLAALWYAPGRPPLFLRAAARLYGAVLALRRGAYRAGLLRTCKASVPVVVVGNVTVGGTGKSPLSAWLVRALAARGRRPGIASRGYGRRTRGVRLVGPADGPDEVGDEPLMLAQETGVPVCVAAHRFDAVERLAAAGCDVVICDDGLQHLALARDLEIAVLDGARGIGNGWLLPAGPLREPATRLSSVGAVAMHGDGLPPVPALHLLRFVLAPSPLCAVAGDGSRPLAWLQGLEVHGVTGIGHPERFFTLLRQLGATVREHAFDDHHRFELQDIAFDDALPVIMTAKDAVKCRALAGPRHWCLPVAAALSEPDENWLLGRILAL